MNFGPRALDSAAAKAQRKNLVHRLNYGELALSLKDNYSGTSSVKATSTCEKKAALVVFAATLWHTGTRD